MNPFRSNRLVLPGGATQQLLRFEGAEAAWRLVEVASDGPVQAELSWSIPSTYERRAHLTLTQGRVCVLAQHLELSLTSLSEEDKPVSAAISDALVPTQNVLDQSVAFVDSGAVDPVTQEWVPQIDPLLVPLPPFSRAVRLEDAEVHAELLDATGQSLDVLAAATTQPLGRAASLRLSSADVRSVRLVFFLSL